MATDPDLDPVLQHYTSLYDEDARLRAGVGRIEMARVQEIVRGHLGPRPQQVADVGGGTGIHAEWLLDDGHQVTLVDLTPRHVETARRRLADRGLVAVQGDARHLPLPDGGQDAVLLLGPLYHLQERADRLAAWREAGRVLAPGGLVVAMAITRFASLIDGLGSDMFADPEFRRIVADDLATGRHTPPPGRPRWFTRAYFHHPGELAVEASEAGLEVVGILAVEGPAGWWPESAALLDDASTRTALLDAVRAVEEEPSLLGASPHVICIARVRR